MTRVTIYYAVQIDVFFWYVPIITKTLSLFYKVTVMGARTVQKSLCIPLAVATWVGTRMLFSPSFTKVMKKARTRPDFAWFALVSCVVAM